jgi:hypothetical protein
MTSDVRSVEDGLSWVRIALMLVFAVSAFAAIGSRLALYAELRKRSIPMKLFWTSTPGYLESVYWKNVPDPERSRLRLLVRTASISFAVAMVAGLVSAFLNS